MTLPTLAYPPRMTEFTQRFWDALRDGRFETTRCTACGHMTFPPKPICPECWKRDTLEWVELKGTGVLRSFTEVCAAPAIFADEAPYVLAIVDLDENVRCVSRILADFDELTPDMRVRVQPRPAEPAYLFDFVIDRTTDNSEEQQ